MKVLVTGSRSWDKIAPIMGALSKLPRSTVVVHGGARGADALTEDAAKQLGLKTEVHLAQWEVLGKRAGVIRNLEMLDSRPDLVLAFWDGESRGTKQCVDAARARGIETVVFKR